MKLIWKFLVWLDIEVNDKWFHGRKETISSRVYRRGKQGKCPLCIWLCNKLDTIDHNHCADAYIGDRKRNPNLPV